MGGALRDLIRLPCLRAVGPALYDAPMPIAVEYDDRRRWVFARATGTLTLEEVLHFIHTARAGEEHRMWPLLFDASSATTNATEADVDRAVAAVERVVHNEGPRGHVALIADDDELYARMLFYEARCAAIGVRTIRAFRQRKDAEQWLEILSAARYFTP